MGDVHEEYTPLVGDVHEEYSLLLGGCTWGVGLCDHNVSIGVNTNSIRAVPEIILGGAFFFRPLHPQDTHGVTAPRPSGHPRPTMDQIRLDPQDKLPHPHPSDTLSTKHLSPHRTKKSACGPPPRIISGTALTIARIGRFQQGYKSPLSHHYATITFLVLDLLINDTCV